MRIPNQGELKRAHVLDIAATDEGLTSFEPEVNRPRRSFEPKRAHDTEDALAAFEPARLSIRLPGELWRRTRLSIGFVALGVVAWLTLAVLNSSDSRLPTPLIEPQLTQADSGGAPALPSAPDPPPAERVQTISETAARVPVTTEPRRAPAAAAIDTGARDTLAIVALPSPVPTTGLTALETATAPPRIASPIDAPSAPAVVAAPVSAPSPVVEPPPPAPATSVPAPAAATPRVASHRAAVEAVLGQYASAFSALDARRAKAVWPSVNQKNLERAFDSLEQQEFDLGACDITVLPPRALALCDGTARYTPKVGNRKARTEPRRWSFTLQQTGQEWAIESVNLR